MLPRIADGPTTQWEVMKWVYAQGQFLANPHQSVVLSYLAANAWYKPDNPEGAQVGQVLYGASKYEQIMTATAIRSRGNVRKVLNELQDQAYVYRAERKPWGNHEPLQIMVFWEERWDDLREGLRAGTKMLPAKLLERPSRPTRTASVTPLRMVEEVAE